MKSPILIVLALMLAGCAGARQPAAGPGTADRRDIIAEALAGSVQLFAQRPQGRRAGSGVVIAVEGEDRALILTAAHLLVPGEVDSIVAVEPGSGSHIEASLRLLDVENDVALLEAEGLAAAPLRLQADARLGDPVWVVSFPWGRRGTFVTGVVSQIHERDGGTGIPMEGPVGLIDAAVSYGTSGGGVFDSRSGRLLGIVRGYRTARISLPGAESEALEFPIAGETTVIPTPALLCLLRDAGLEPPLPAQEPTAVETACGPGQMERADAAG